MENEFVKLQNDTVDTWRQKLEGELKSKATKSHNQFKFRTKNKKEARTGKTIAVGVSMVQHAVYKEKGVGRGRGIDSGKTTPDPLYNPVIESLVPELADTFALNLADTLYRALIK